MARVCTYLSFSGKTEEAFNFYKSVFGGEFGGKGIARFSDIPEVAGHPIPDEDKNMIMHIELEILGGHVLMGSDTPQSMGYNLTNGNNIYIDLEPDSRAMTQQLFDALSAEGAVSMKLQDTFWGAYYGTCTDKFGVHWMFNCVESHGLF